jgi:hypothetical protein
MQARVHGRRSIAPSLAIGLLGLLSPSAEAATQVGETFTPNTGPPAGLVVLQSGSPMGEYAMPFAGVVTSWSHHAPASNAAELKFKVARPAAGDSFTIIGEDGPRTFIPGVLNTFPTRIPVLTGDVIGFYIVSDPGGGTSRVTNMHPRHIRGGDPPVGSTLPYAPSGNALQLDVSATLEPDCDGDGFGDETQDPSVLGGSCPIRGRALTLDVSKNKVKKGRNVTFSGQLTEVVRQGECQSAQTVDVARKKPKQTAFTTFEQLQTDAGGSFSTTEKVKKTFEYQAQVAQTATCAGHTSNTEKVKVKKRRK